MAKPITPQEMTAYVEATWNKCQEEKEWVGLTLEDKKYLNEVLNLQGRFPVIDAIEAKLKEKNT